MDNPKLRKLLILLHLFGAAFMAPAFLLVAISGGNYLLDNKGSFETTPISLPASATLDFKSPSLEEDVRTLLKSSDIKHKFDYIRNRGSVIQLRPTSRKYIEMKQTPKGLEASYKKPNLVAAMMELHKGHGPSLFKTYQKLVALTLFLVVFGGLLVGLLAKAYRRKTVGALAFGAIVFIFLVFFA